jgi:Mrp family chromosome partitioning ATPase
MTQIGRFLSFFPVATVHLFVAGCLMRKITMQRMLNIYGSRATRSMVLRAESAGKIPAPTRTKTGSLARRVWQREDLPALGQYFGFLNRPSKPTCIAVYSAKGGVFKTSIAFNLARASALHNIKTCVLGLDFQCDITRVLENADEDTSDLDATIQKIWRTRGLAHALAGEDLTGIVEHADLPTSQKQLI